MALYSSIPSIEWDIAYKPPLETKHVTIERKGSDAFLVQLPTLTPNVNGAIIFITNDQPFRMYDLLRSIYQFYQGVAFAHGVPCGRHVDLLRGRRWFRGCSETGNGEGLLVLMLGTLPN